VRAEALAGIKSLREATTKLLGIGASDMDRALSVAVPYLMMCGFALGGWLMARAAKLVSADRAAVVQEFNAGKIAAARAYVGRLLPRAQAYGQMILKGSDSVASVDAALI
jgi:hypothetical protein